ncbi:hypothetical protein RMSM_03906 [Rhodopirellula maiorica SM1]|uniref:Uncharacterized protein n=1 Tax=Rhodopirellula maiorica SM1 TaxID=1265738 RepID=M5RIM8_9BACT|nr:hypothetical protein RMSM_03906 [Rhodopirellula maiorica SM1]
MGIAPSQQQNLHTSADREIRIDNDERTTLADLADCLSLFVRGNPNAGESTCDVFT